MSKTGDSTDWIMNGNDRRCRREVLRMSNPKWVPLNC